MAYYLARLYEGSGSTDPEELSQDTVRELLPQLQEAGGLLRYTTFVTDDGRIGSASTYENREAAQRGLEIARQWAKASSVTTGYQHSQTVQGEIVRRMTGDAPRDTSAVGVGRLYRTGASAEQVASAIADHGIPGAQLPGRVVTVVVQLDDGRVGTFANYDSGESMERHAEYIRRQRRELDPIKSVLPNDPEEIRVRILSVTGH
jgi:hypothetical protein